MSNRLEQAVLALRNDEQATQLLRFYKTGPGQYAEGDRFLGVKIPQLRRVAKLHWRDVSFDELDHCLASEWHEVRMCALIVLVAIFNSKGKVCASQSDCIDFYLSHLSRVNNWDLVDGSSSELLGAWLFDKDPALLYHLAQHGTTLWEQRIGIVSTLYFVRHGRLDDTFAIADILLNHPHDLIHKAVGWLLREAGKQDERCLRTYLATRYRDMPRTMLRYAIERFPSDLRQHYLKGRIVEVVAAVIVDHNQLFATCRSDGKWAGWWEFPGGKLERGETLQQALHREIQEELAVEINVGSLIETIDWDYDDFHLTMHCFRCTIEGHQKPTLNVHSAGRWLTQAELNSLRWLPADRDFVARLQL